MEDQFCKNFDCIISFEPAEQCFTYIKTIYDVDCHLFCKLDNCTREPTTETFCPVYTCWPTASTTTSTTALPPSADDSTLLILSSTVGAAIFFSLICLISVYIYKCCKRRQHQEIIDDSEANLNEHFVVSNPSQSSSEDFETQAPILHVPDHQLENEIQMMLSCHQTESVASSSSLVTNSLEIDPVAFKMCTFGASKTMANVQNCVETTAF